MPDNKATYNKTEQYKELRQELQFYKQIATKANSIEIVRDPKGNIIFINNSAEFVTGYTKEELSHTVSIQELLHPEDAEMALITFKAMFTQQKPISGYKFRIITKDNSIKHLSLSAIPLFEEGQFTGVHESLNDITESVLLQEKIEDLKLLEEKVSYQNEENSKLNLKYKRTIERLKEAQEISKTANWELDVDAKTFNWSEEIKRILEVSSNDFDNSLETFLEYTHPEDRDKVLNAINRVISNQLQYDSITHRIVTQNSNTKYVEARCQIRYGDNNKIKYLYGTITDITERINIEHNLSESKANVEKLANELGKAKKFYKEKLELILSPESDLTDITITDIIDLRQLQKLQDSFVQATGVASIITDLNGKPITNASEFSKICSCVRETPIGKQNCFNSDKIIGTKAIEQNKPIFEECHSCGFIDAGAPILIGDKPIALWLIGQVSFDKPNREKVEDYFNKIGGDTSIIESELSKLKITTPDKFEKILHFLSTLAQEISNLAYTNVVLAKKIEEQKKMQVDLQQAKEQSEEGDKLKTAFLHNLSHEIRTPMNAIVGFSEMLKLTDTTEESRLKYADFIVDNSKQLLSIVNDILTMSTLETKQEKITTSEVCINQLLANLTEEYQNKHKDSTIVLHLNKTLSDEEACIYSDKSKLEHILNRLLINAYKYTNNGTIEISYILSNNQLTFTVKDSGIGIEQHKLDTIFKRFSNAENTITTLYGGTGLGLAIAKGFVELLGGEIWVESEPNIGSTFYFTTPYKPSMQTSKLKNNTPTNASVSTTKTILIAEDHEYNFIFLQELLKHMDVNLLHARNGKEAINVINTDTTIDLILMDIKMPEVDGHTAALEIKKKYPKLPIIAQSAFALEHEKRRFGGKAFDDYITKPIDRTMLLDAIKKYITV